MTTIDKSLFANGIRFECTGCGECCRARHGYGFIYVNLKERRRLAAQLGMTTAAFTRKHCEKTDGWHHLRQPAKDCHFLDGARCTVYEARPEQCRTWPFWRENMSKKVWDTEVRRDCEGVGVGRLWSREEISAILSKQR
jgi:Fe-S-cluster containining protein